jgi:hypothetical protein
MGNEPTVTVVTRDQTITPGLVVTPAGSPNIIFQTASTAGIILIRAIRTFLQTMFSGGLIASLSGTLLPGDILSKLKVAAVFSLGAVVINIGQNLLEIATSLDKKYPNLMG